MGFALRFEVVEALPQPLGERVIRVTVLDLAQDVVLFAGDVGELALSALTLLETLLSRGGVQVVQTRREQPAPLRTEDALGEELVDHVHDQVFSHVDRRGVTLVFVWATAVVIGRMAAVVSHTPSGIAGHAATAVAHDTTAEQTGPGRLRVVLQRGTIT
nr:hypothetical protein [Labedaea rhizosphaerae]